MNWFDAYQILQSVPEQLRLKGAFYHNGAKCPIGTLGEVCGFPVHILNRQDWCAFDILHNDDDIETWEEDLRDYLIGLVSQRYKVDATRIISDVDNHDWDYVLGRFEEYSTEGQEWL